MDALPTGTGNPPWHTHQICRSLAGSSVLSGLWGKLVLGRSLGKLTSKQLGDEDEIDQDVKAEAERVASGGADKDVVKVSQCFRPPREGRQTASIPTLCVENECLFARSL